MFRTLADDISPMQNIKLQFPDLRLSSFIIDENSQLAGKSLAELDVRNRYGFSIFAIKRKDEVIGNPNAATVLQKDDIVLILTKSDEIPELTKIFG